MRQPRANGLVAPNEGLPDSHGAPSGLTPGGVCRERIAAPIIRESPIILLPEPHGCEEATRVLTPSRTMPSSHPPRRRRTPSVPSAQDLVPKRPVTAPTRRRGRRAADAAHSPVAPSAASPFTGVPVDHVRCDTQEAAVDWSVDEYNALGHAVRQLWAV